MSKTLKIRQFHFGTDYPDVCDWWRAHKWPYILKEDLSPLGLVVEDGTHKFCAGWLYFAGHNWAWLEWVVTNPKAPLKPRKKALELLVLEALKAAKLSGVRNVISSLQNKNLIRLYESQGFKITDLNMTNLIAKVNP